MGSFFYARLDPQPNFLNETRLRVLRLVILIRMLKLGE